MPGAVRMIIICPRSSYPSRAGREAFWNHQSVLESSRNAQRSIMNQRLSVRRLLLLGAVLLYLIGSGSPSFPNSQPGPGSPQEMVRIPDISTPKKEFLVDVAGRKLHGCVYGNGSPTVVLVSGLDAPQVYWNPVVPDLASRTTVVTYDRAGVGKSQIGRLPTHGAQSAKDLRALLGQLAVPKPYILVGHSYGGSVVRLFASMFPEDMGGLILEDTQHEDALDELRKSLTGKDLEALDRLMAARFRTPKNPTTEADYREMTRGQLRQSRPLPWIPFVVLTAAGRAKAMGPMFSAEAIEIMAAKDLALNHKLAALISGGELIIVEGTGHNIHVDKPEALTVPLAEMIRKARAKRGEGEKEGDGS